MVGQGQVRVVLTLTCDQHVDRMLVGHVVDRARLGLGLGLGVGVGVGLGLGLG